MKLNLCCPTLFGLEGIVADELRFEGKLTNVRAENGRVFFEGDFDTLAWANLNLRCAERVLICLGSFKAYTFDDLFEGVRALNWEDFIPINGSFPVKGHSLNSELHSIPACQGIVKKAVVKKLGAKYGVSDFDENGPRYQIQFSIMNNVVDIFLDTSGAGLHKRGYRANANAAPLRETLAAAMIKLARYKGRDEMLDPFCGSGTLAIEAAMIAMRKAPGMMRRFEAEHWESIDQNIFKNARAEAVERVVKDTTYPIFASDIDPECVDLSVSNARKAGVLHTVRFDVADATKREYSNQIIFANPPYGERLLDIESAQRLYGEFSNALGDNCPRRYILSSDIEFEKCFNKKADKRRKLYNGMIKCDLYMYFKSH